MPLTSSLVGLTLSDRFRIEEKVGEELLGSLFLATDEGAGEGKPKRVIVKVLHPHLSGNKEKFARFGREITATDMVKHPNTVAVVGWGQHLELHFLVLEYLVCHPLADELAKGPMAPERAAHIAAQIASAVGAAHQEGVVHRNLSPHNVLLLDNSASGDFVKVRDFGLSKLDNVDTDDTGTNLTQVGARVGNTHYMAPEYVEEGTVHPKGDLYAVGALFYHMVTGRTPYEGRAAEVLTAHIADPVPVPRAVRPELPIWCDEVVASLMAKRPKERPGGYQVVQTLEAHVGHSLAAPDLLDVRDDGTVVRPSNAPMVAAGVAGIAMLAVAALLALLALTTAVGYGAYSIASRAPAPEQGLEPVAPVVREPPPAAAVPAAPADAPAPAAPTRARPSPRAAKPSPPASPAPKAPAADAVGRVEVTASTRALVFIDDDVQGYTPIVLSAPAGTHTVRVMIPGQSDTMQEQEIRFGPSTNERIRIDF